jgi:peptidoglycan/xylan/chitin deacetylase (PgdA/CDA1 family)
VALASGALSWPWVVGGLLANHAVLFAACLTPRSSLLGPNLVRLPAAATARQEVAVTFDDGPDPAVTPRLLDLLDERRAVGTFFCIGERAAAHPKLVREIVARGHSVESHSHWHAWGFGWKGPWRLRRDVASAQRAIEDAAGVSPRFFRAPFGVRNPMLAPTLASLGLSYVSWTRRGFDAVDGDAARVLRRLTRRLGAGDILLLHDGSVVGERRERTALRVLPGLLTSLAERGLRSVSLRAACGLAAGG